MVNKGQNAKKKGVEKIGGGGKKGKKSNEGGEKRDIGGLFGNYSYHSPPGTAAKESRFSAGSERPG